MKTQTRLWEHGVPWWPLTFSFHVPKMAPSPRACFLYHNWHGIVAQGHTTAYCELDSGDKKYESRGQMQDAHKKQQLHFIYTLNFRPEEKNHPNLKKKLETGRPSPLKSISGESEIKL